MQESTPKTDSGEDFTQGLDYPTEDKEGFEGLMSGKSPDVIEEQGNSDTSSFSDSEKARKYLEERRQKEKEKKRKWEDYTPEQTELAEKIFGELTPEQISKIREKVRDIYQTGTAHTSIGENNVTAHGLPLWERLKSVLHLGVISSNRIFKIWKDRGMPLLKNQEERAKETQGNVYFNIVGKSVIRKGGYNMEGNYQSSWKEKYDEEIGPFYYFIGKRPNIAVIFDLSKYKDAREQEYLDFTKSSEEFINRAGWMGPTEDDSYTYSGNRDLLSKVPLGEDGLPKADAEYGYAIRNMIPIAYFLGLVLYSPSSPHKHLLKEVLTCMALNTNPENFVPIYDVKGNLLWPERKSHKQIVKELAKNQEAKEGHE